MISKQNWKFFFQTPETVWTVFHVTSVLKQAESLWILAMYECALHGIVLTCGCSDDDGLGKCSRAHAVILLQQCLQLLAYSLVSYIQRLAVDDPTISDTDHLFAHTIFHRMGKPSSSFHLEDSASLDAPLTVRPFFLSKGVCALIHRVVMCGRHLLWFLLSRSVWQSLSNSVVETRCTLSDVQVFNFNAQIAQHFFVVCVLFCNE